MKYSVITVIAMPPKRRTIKRRLFFQPDGGVHRPSPALPRTWAAISGHSLALARSPGNVQIRLSPCLVVNFAFNDSKARWIMDQAFQPCRLAYRSTTAPFAPQRLDGNGTRGPSGR